MRGGEVKWPARHQSEREWSAGEKDGGGVGSDLIPLKALLGDGHFAAKTLECTVGYAVR